MTRTGLQSVKFPIRGVIVKNDFDAMDAIFDLVVPDIFQLLRIYHATNVPGLVTIRSDDFNLFGLFAFRPPPGLYIKEGQLYQLYLSHSFQGLVSYFDKIKYRTKDFATFKALDEITVHLEAMAGQYKTKY